MSKTILHTFTQETKKGVQDPKVSKHFNPDWCKYLNNDIQKHTRSFLSLENELYIIESLGCGIYAVALIEYIGGRGNTNLSRVVVEANKKVKGADITKALQQLIKTPQESPIEVECTDVVTLLSDGRRNISGEQRAKEYLYCELGDMTIEEVIDHYLPVAHLEDPNYRGVIFSKKECKGKEVIKLDKKIITLNFPKDECTDGKFKYEIKVKGKSIKPQNGETAFEVYEGSDITVVWSADGFETISVPHKARERVSLDLKPEDIQKTYTGNEFISNPEPNAEIKATDIEDKKISKVGTVTISLADFCTSNIIEFELECPNLWTKDESGKPMRFALKKEQFLGKEGIKKERLDPKSYTIIYHRGTALHSYQDIQKLGEKEIEDPMSVDENVKSLQTKINEKDKTIAKITQRYESKITSLNDRIKSLKDQLEEADKNEQEKKGWVKKYLATLAVPLIALLGVIGSNFIYIELFQGMSRAIPNGRVVLPYGLEVALEKDVHLIFPAPIRSVDGGSQNIIAEKAKGAENELCVKAAEKDFKTETNMSVTCEDGSFYAFNVKYADEPEKLSIDMSQPPYPLKWAYFKELGNESPVLVKLLMQTIYQNDKRTIKHISTQKFGMKFLLRGLYAHNGLIYFHTRIENSTNMPYSVDSITFKVVDKKEAKRTATQELQPLRAYHKVMQVRGKDSEHPVFVLEQFALSEDKQLEVTLYGRNGGCTLTFYVEQEDLQHVKKIDNLKLKW